LKKVLLPEMTWPEVGETLKETNVAIIPVGSCEQHGEHLPLGTDHLLAFTMARTIAEEAGAVVAPILWVGYSEQHMGFPGTVTLTTDTLVQVLIEACRSLSKHGFKKILLLNAHGGNDVACNFAAQKVNMELSDTAVVLFGVSDLLKYLPGAFQIMDLHAGIEETAMMLALKPEVIVKPEVDMSKAKRPTITLPPALKAIVDRLREDPSAIKLILTKLPMVHEISDTGSLVLGDPSEATKRVENTKKNMEKYCKDVVSFIREWKKT
jgi:creatinine amidohydrolase